jgi:hypothetical protein
VWSNYEKRYTILKTWAEAQFSPQRGEYGKNSSSDEPDVLTPEGSAPTKKPTSLTTAAAPVDQYLAQIMALSSQSDSWKSTQTVVTVDPKDIQGGGELIMSHNLKVRKRFFSVKF